MDGVRILGGGVADSAEADGGAGGASADSADGDEGRGSGEASRRGEIASEPLSLSTSPRSGCAGEAGDEGREDVRGRERLEDDGREARSDWEV
jgi:hypothetical protein